MMNLMEPYGTIVMAETLFWQGWKSWKWPTGVGWQKRNSSSRPATQHSRIWQADLEQATESSPAHSLTWHWPGLAFWCPTKKGFGKLPSFHVLWQEQSCRETWRGLYADHDNEHPHLQPQQLTIWRSLFNPSYPPPPRACYSYDSFNLSLPAHFNCDNK